jgi:hypothetical protein
VCVCVCVCVCRERGEEAFGVWRNKTAGSPILPSWYVCLTLSLNDSQWVFGKCQGSLLWCWPSLEESGFPIRKFVFFVLSICTCDLLGDSPFVCIINLKFITSDFPYSLLSSIALPCLSKPLASSWSLILNILFQIPGDIGKCWISLISLNLFLRLCPFIQDMMSLQVLSTSSQNWNMDTSLLQQGCPERWECCWDALPPNVIQWYLVGTYLC